MRALVTGSSGHLGEALVRTLQEDGEDVVGLDIKDSAFTAIVGSVTDRECVRQAMRGVEVVFHTATLHKPHISTHSRQEFIEANITGTLHLLEEAVRAGIVSFIYTSTTSVFGDALTPPAGARAAWITEDATPVPKNIYGVTKAAAEDLCQLFHRNENLPCLVLRTSRFFPEEDDNREIRLAYSDANAKANEFLYRRVDIGDVVSAQLLAAKHAAAIGFRKYIISASTPFQPEDVTELRKEAPKVVRRYVPEYEHEYARRGWEMFPSISRVYVNERARKELGWRPEYDFQRIVRALSSDEDLCSPLARLIGSKGYHSEQFRDGPYPVD